MRALPLLAHYVHQQLGCLEVDRRKPRARRGTCAVHQTKTKKGLFQHLRWVMYIFEILTCSGIPVPLYVSIRISRRMYAQAKNVQVSSARGTVTAFQPPGDGGSVNLARICKVAELALHGKRVRFEPLETRRRERQRQQQWHQSHTDKHNPL